MEGTILVSQRNTQGSAITQNLIYCARFVTIATLVGMIAVGVIGIYVPIHVLPIALSQMSQTLGYAGSLTCLVGGTVLFVCACVYFVRQHRLNKCINQLINSGLLNPNEVGYLRTSTGWQAVWHHNQTYVRSPIERTLTTCFSKLKKQFPQDPFLIRGEFRTTEKSAQFFDQVVAALLLRKQYDPGSTIYYKTLENLYQVIQLSDMQLGIESYSYGYQTETLDECTQNLPKEKLLGEFDLGTETLRKLPDDAAATGNGYPTENERNHWIQYYLENTAAKFLESGAVVCFEIQSKMFVSACQLNRKTVRWSQIYSNPEMSLRALRHEFHNWEDRWDVVGMFNVSTKKLSTFLNF